MSELRGWMIYSWIALPTVMYGGYSILQLLNKANAITPFRLTWFRAGHAHAGVLLLMSLLYYTFMDKTSLSPAVKHAGCATVVVEAFWLSQADSSSIWSRGSQTVPRSGPRSPRLARYC
jgi:hypothetical protein